MFDHENLDCYRLARKVSRWFAKTSFPKGDAKERDQGLRAARSVVRNIAEGRSRRPEQSEARHYRIALASAAEACAVLDNVIVSGAEERQDELRRVGQMLRKLIIRVEAGELGRTAEEHMPRHEQEEDKD
jgi:four helix bundle protein